MTSDIGRFYVKGVEVVWKHSTSQTLNSSGMKTDLNYIRL